MNANNLQQMILKADTSPKHIYRLRLCHVICNEKKSLALLRHLLPTFYLPHALEHCYSAMSSLV